MRQTDAPESRKGMKILLSIIVLLGIATATLPVATGKARAYALASDFMAFKSRVHNDGAGERILKYGGENEKETFDILLDRLITINDSSIATPLGLLLSALAGFGLIIESKRTKKHEPDRAGNG